MREFRKNAFWLHVHARCCIPSTGMISPFTVQFCLSLFQAPDPIPMTASLPCCVELFEYLWWFKYIYTHSGLVWAIKGKEKLLARLLASFSVVTCLATPPEIFVCVQKKISVFRVSLFVLCQYLVSNILQIPYMTDFFQQSELYRAVYVYQLLANWVAWNLVIVTPCYPCVFRASPGTRVTPKSTHISPFIRLKAADQHAFSYEQPWFRTTYFGIHHHHGIYIYKFCYRLWRITNPSPRIYSWQRKCARGGDWRARCAIRIGGGLRQLSEQHDDDENGTREAIGAENTGDKRSGAVHPEWAGAQRELLFFRGKRVGRNCLEYTSGLGVLSRWCGDRRA